MQNVMNIMKVTGDLEIKWNPKNKQECDEVKRQFNNYIEKGYTAFYKGLFGKNKIMKEFDPSAKRVILIPPLVGG